jgi:Ni,Fe-hydrogenase I large subunit
MITANMNNTNKKKKNNIKTSRPTNLSMSLFVIGSAMLNIGNIMIEDKYINISVIAASEIIIFIGMLLAKNNEDNDKNKNESTIENNNNNENSFRIEMDSLPRVYSEPHTYFTGINPMVSPVYVTKTEACKAYYESRASQMINDNNKINLDLFKTMHTVVLQISKQSDFIESHMLETIKAIQDINLEIQDIKKDINNLNLKVDQIKEIVDKKEECKLQKSASTSSISSLKRPSNVFPKPLVTKKK